MVAQFVEMSTRADGAASSNAASTRSSRCCPTRQRRDHAEGARVREGVQQPRRRGIAEKCAVRSLIEKQAGGIARREIQAIPDAILPDVARERKRRIPADEHGRIAILVLAWEQ